MRVGGTIDLLQGSSLDTEFRKLRSFGMNSCQLVCWDHALLTDETAAMVCERSYISAIVISLYSAIFLPRS